MKKRDIKIEFYEILGGFGLAFSQYLDTYINEEDEEKWQQVIDDFCYSMSKRAEKMKQNTK